MVDNDTFAHFPSPSYPVKIPRNADGGLQWTWYALPCVCSLHATPSAPRCQGIAENWGTVS